MTLFFQNELSAATHLTSKLLKEYEKQVCSHNVNMLAMIEVLVVMDFPLNCPLCFLWHVNALLGPGEA